MRYVCVHGHFYQPPRENPWLEAIQQQDSAYPYHDWNERVTAESYAPNSAARILDDHNRIIAIVNNYRDISFNFGPTLLSWFEDVNEPSYKAILEADQRSRERYNGHGSAMAQNYGHLIMPLANSRDKETQVLWGIADFRHRYQRDPEGMWLAETAVDLESLDLMAKHGIRFTVLAPRQASAVRPQGTEAWFDVSNGSVDPKRPYRVQLKEGRSIVVFFYDGPVSQAVAFERLLNSGERFANRLLGTFDQREEPQLMHIATDGETYGHHHRFGEMALAYALRYIEQRGLARITNYAAFLAEHPPTWEARIIENTAWSCYHGVKRWSDDCGCSTGGNPGWHQRWRRPLRDTFDWLRDTIIPMYETEAGRLLKDPWAARNDYINVILDRSLECRNAFLAKHAVRELTASERVHCWNLLELQRNALLIYTSCGWFFDDISGIEATQVLFYLGRLLQLVEHVWERNLEPDVLTRLAEAKSNVPQHRDAAAVYEKFVKPLRTGLREVGAHYAISSIFEDYQPVQKIYCYEIKSLAGTAWRDGKLSLVTGRIAVSSLITEDTADLVYSALHFGDHNVICGVRQDMSEEMYASVHEQLQAAFAASDTVGVQQLHQRYFGTPEYTLRNLFPDEQRTVILKVLEATTGKVDAAYRAFYEEYASLLRLYGELKIPLPKVLSAAAQYAVHARLRAEVTRPDVNEDVLRAILIDAAEMGVELDATSLEFDVRQSLQRGAQALAEDPHNLAKLDELVERSAVLPLLRFDVTLWTTQNLVYEVLSKHGPAMRDRMANDERASAWLRSMRVLCERLSILWPL